MSNTRHARPSRSIHNMRVQNRRKAEAAALEALLEDADGTQIRHVNRLKSYWTQIPEPWNDKPHAAWKEFHNKNYWVKRFEEMAKPRYSKRNAYSDFSAYAMAGVMENANAAGIELMVIDFSRCGVVVY